MADKMITYDNLVHPNLEDYLRDVLNNAVGKVAIRLRCDNNYGASIIRHAFSYGGNEGLFELAVLKFWGYHDSNSNLCYDTDITNDVLGHLSVEDVVGIVRQISALPMNEIDG